MIDPKDWPASKIETWDVARIKPYAKNARTHSMDDILAARRAIDEYGWTYPLLVDDTGELIAGHRRFAASQLEPPMEEVPVLVARGWSAAKIKAYRIWDNKSTLSGGWDENLLRAELGELQSLDFPLELVGFSPTDLAAIAMPGFTNEEALRRAEVTPAPVEKPVVAAGELWILGKHRLIIGDSTDAPTIERLLDGAKPHLMVTDPPYGVNYDPAWRLEAGVNKPWQTRAEGTVTNDDNADWRKAWALFPGDVAYVWHGALHAPLVAESLLACEFQIRSQIIWAKPSLVMGRGDYHWKHEPCWYAVRKGKKGHYIGGRKQSTVWDIQNMHATQGDVDDGKTNHSTQKPIECMRRPIVNNSQKGDAVYEPFAGSGTSLIACEMEGRVCYAAELSPVYGEMILRRWAAYAGKEPVREDGVTLTQLGGAPKPDAPKKPAPKPAEKKRK